MKKTQIEKQSSSFSWDAEEFDFSCISTSTFKIPYNVVCESKASYFLAHTQILKQLGFQMNQIVEHANAFQETGLSKTLKHV